MSNRSTPAESLLTELGFTAMEAAVYRALVEASPATGYRVAQQIGKPIANTYKAIESLAAKGAVLVDDGEHRSCRAVPPGELLRRLERSFRDRCAAAEEELLRLTHSNDDNRVYPLKSKAQVNQRARAMIERSSRVLLADLFPAPALELRGALSAAAARGVRVGCLVYEPIEIEGVRVVQALPYEWFKAWPGDQVIVIADAMEHLVAVLERGPESTAGVVQALWSPSVLLTLAQHDGLMSQLIAHRLDSLLEEGADVPRISRERRELKHLSVVHTPGFEKLIGSFESPGSGWGRTVTDASPSGGEGEHQP